MRLLVLAVAVLACGKSSTSSDPPPSGSGSSVGAGSGTPTAPSDAAVVVVNDAATPDAPDVAVDDSPPGYDFTPIARDLLAVGACGDAPIPAGFPTARIARHCAAIKKTQDSYATKWVAKARTFFAENVPAGLPKKVVYPFAGGDLSTALTVYPDADEITTISLEPAGDPRTLEVLKKTPGGSRADTAPDTAPFEAWPDGRPVKPDVKPGEKPGGKVGGKPSKIAKPPGKVKSPQPEPKGKVDDEDDPPEIDPISKVPKMIRGKTGLDRALATIQYEMHFLYHVNFSNTLNMIDAMRGGQLPTQLVFGLSALKVHGYEVVSLRYFRLTTEGGIDYLDEADVKKAPDAKTGSPDHRNRVFANAELRFRRPGGRVQIYRHLQVNLDDPHMKKDPRLLRHLEAKGEIAGMTKAASYLLAWDSFSMIRRYLLEHVVWMVSDATGVAPRWGTPAGFEYETYGAFRLAHINSGNQIAKNWHDEWERQPKRPLAFRFGYYDGTPEHASHLVIMRKKK